MSKYWNGNTLLRRSFSTSGNFRTRLQSEASHHGNRALLRARQTTVLSSRHLIGQTTGATPTPGRVIKSPYPDLDLPESPFLAHYIMENWSNFGNKVALVSQDTGEEVTYSQLRDRVVRVSSALTRQGFAKGDIMMILSHNCLEFVVLQLAAMAAGIIVSAVNPLNTPGELQYSVNLTRAKLIVVSPDSVNTVKEALQYCPSVLKVMSIGDVDGYQPFSSLLADDGRGFPTNIKYDSKEDVALLPFSNGTTGLIKGVMMTNHSAVANIEQSIQKDSIDISEDDSMLGLLPMYHAFGQIVVMLSALRVGAKLVVMPKFDPPAFLDAIQKHKLTYLHLVPPIIRLFATYPELDRYDLASLRTILYAAAPISAKTVSAAKERLKPEVVFKEGYGMTESGPVVATTPSATFEPGNCGNLLPNTEMKILDMKTGEMLGPNQEGEICVRGPQVMKGYWENEAATKMTLSWDGWLQTGDIGFFDDKERLVITDRMKELVKYKAIQVPPAELEEVLMSHPSIAEAAVIGVPDDDAGEIPRAYVTLKAGHSISEEDVLAYVSGLVAPYKRLRGGVVFKEEIPKSTQGKILRRVLKREVAMKA